MIKHMINLLKYRENSPILRKFPGKIPHFKGNFPEKFPILKEIYRKNGKFLGNFSKILYFLGKFPENSEKSGFS